jgi:hypothetical protein
MEKATSSEGRAPKMMREKQIAPHFVGAGGMLPRGRFENVRRIDGVRRPGRKKIGEQRHDGNRTQNESGALERRIEAVRLHQPASRMRGSRTT